MSPPLPECQNERNEKNCSQIEIGKKIENLLESRPNIVLVCDDQPPNLGHLKDFIFTMRSLFEHIS